MISKSLFRSALLATLALCSPAKLRADLSLSPDPASLTLPSGDTGDITFTLTNTSDTESANWQSETRGGSLEDVLAAFDENHLAISALVPNQYLFSGGVTGTSISDGGGDMYDGGNFLHTDIGINIPYSDGVLANPAPLGPTGRYFTRKQPGLFLFAADFDTATQLRISGNLGADGGGLVGTAEFTYGSFRIFFKKVYNAGDPSINHLIIVRDNPGLARTFNTSTANENHSVTGIDPGSRVYYLLFASSSGGNVPNATALSIAEALLGILGSLFVEVVAPASGQLPANGQTALSVTLDARTLNAGSYQTELGVSSPSGDDTALINLTVTAAAGLQSSPSAISFGDVFAVVASAPSSVEVENVGSLPLTVFASTTGAPFSTTGDTVTIAPGGTAEVPVTFAPSATGPASGTLTLATNDPTNPTVAIPLSGNGITAPFAFDPGGIALTLGTGESATAEFTVTNTSGSTFEWELFTEGDDLASVRARFTEEAGGLGDLIPDRFDFTDGTAGTRISDGGFDMYDTGNRLRTDLSTAYIAYNDAGITSSPNLGLDSYFTRKEPGLFFLGADINGVSQFFVEGGAGDGGGTAEGYTFPLRFAGTDYTAVFKRNYGETSPSVNHLFLIEEPTVPVTHTFSSNTNDDTHTVSGLDGARRVYYLLFSTLAGARVSDETVRELALALGQRVLAPPTDRWAGLGFGVLTDGESVALPLEVATALMPAGNYTSRTQFSWGPEGGAGLEGIVSFPLSLTLTSAATVDFSDPAEGGTLDFGTTYVDLNTTSRTTTLRNDGLLPATYDQLSLNGTDFLTTSAPAFPLTLEPGDQTEFELVFAPTTPGPRTETLTLTGAGAPASLGLVGTAETAPLTISPLPLALTISSGDVANYPITLTNPSPNPVPWSLSLAPPSLLETSGVYDATAAGFAPLIPERFDFSEGIVGNSISNGGSSMYSGGNMIHVTYPGGAPTILPYSDGVITPVPGAPSGDNRYFTRKTSGTFFLAADLEGAADFHIEGEINNDIGTVEGGSFPLTHHGVSYTAYFKRIHTRSPFLPSVNHLILVENAPQDLVQTWDEALPSELHTLSGLPPRTRLYYLLFSRANGGVVDDATFAGLADAIVQGIEPSLFDFPEPSSGTLDPGNSIGLDLTINTEFLPASIFQFPFQVSWGTATADVDFDLEITEAPGLALDQTELDFGDTYEFASTVRSINFENRGSQTLNFSGNTISGTVFSFSSTSFSIAPGAARTIDVTFSPVDRGAQNETLTLFTDDPTDSTVTIPLTGSGIRRAVLADFAPTQLTAPQNQIAPSTFDAQLTNIGDEPLTFTTTTAPLIPADDSLEAALARLDAAAPEIVAALPRRLEFRGGDRGERLTSAVFADPASGANEMNVSFAPLEYTGGGIVSAPGRQYFTRKYPGLFVLVVDRFSATSHRTIGALADAPGRIVDSTEFVRSANGIAYQAFAKRVHGAGIPSVNHLFVASGAASASQTISPDTNDDLHVIDSIPSSASGSRSYYLTFSTVDGSQVTDAELEHITDTLIQAVAPPLVSASAPSGTLGPAESTTVTFSVDTANLAPGTYSGTVDFTTDATVDPPLSISIEVTPTGLLTGPNRIDVISIEGDLVPEGAFPLTSADQTQINWTATPPTAPWLSLPSTTGTTPGDLAFTIDNSLHPSDERVETAVEITDSTGQSQLVFVTSIAYPAIVDHLIADPNRSRVYGINDGQGIPGSAIVFAFDGVTGDRIAALPIAQSILSHTLHAADDKLYIGATTGQNEVSVTAVDLETLTVSGSIPADFTLLRHLSPGPPGRAIAELSNGDLRIFDVASGSTINSIDGGEDSLGFAVATTAAPYPVAYRTTASGLLYVLERRTTVGDDITSIVTGGLPITGLEPLVASASGTRVFWGGNVFDESLTEHGDLGAPIYSASPLGELAVSETAVHRLSTGGTNVFSLPVTTRDSAIVGDAQYLFLYDDTTRSSTVLPLRHFTTTPTITTMASTPLGSQSDSAVVIENHGIEQLAIVGQSSSHPDFAIANPMPITVPIGGSVTVTVRYRPTAEGTAIGGITLETGFIEAPTLQITVIGTGTFDPANLPGYAAWSAGDATLANPLADPDGDSLPNFAEYLFDLDPGAPGDPNNHLPTISPDGATLVYVRSSANAGRVTLHSSPDLETWSAAALPAPIVTDMGDGTARVAHALPASGSVLFYRAAAALAAP